MGDSLAGGRAGGRGGRGGSEASARSSQWGRRWRAEVTGGLESVGVIRGGQVDVRSSCIQRFSSIDDPGPTTPHVWRLFGLPTTFVLFSVPAPPASDECLRRGLDDKLPSSSSSFSRSTPLSWFSPRVTEESNFINQIHK